MNKNVPLGFEVGTGAPVDIPLHHVVITGQTQMAGKTTALEALISRSGVKALAFVTKRGEGSFLDARTIPPYFREQADWQFVASILEASRGEKLKFERAWIIRASKGALSLADVQRNVWRLMKTAKGLSADVYLTLEAYLDAVLPQIEQVRWADQVRLTPGLNVMDLTGLNVEMQHLVIRSSLDWVLNRETDTVVVIPEAWKFIPQGRGTPVKLGAEAYIRQAAGLRNYLWLDSQDIAGVEKIILKSVPVWILGVQRESNEVKRTLAQIPAGIKKPKPEEVATLELGEFYACHGKHITKVYVQPAWMDRLEAQAVAQGTSAKRLAPISQKENAVKESEAQALREENALLRRQVAELRERIMGHTADRDVYALDTGKPAAPAPGNGKREGEDFYQWLKARLQDDAPAILRLAIAKPELRVEVERPTVTVDGSTWVGRVAGLIADGFFESPKRSADVFREATRLGASGVAPRADEACKKLLAMGFLTREENGFKAVEGMKVNIVELAER